VFIKARRDKFPYLPEYDGACYKHTTDQG
jgi:hypothetical protein